MKKGHALLIALAVAVAASFGMLAASRTTQLGASAKAAGGVSAAQIAAQNQRLDRAEIALHRQLQRKPPALPALPALAAAPPAQQRVVYVRPAPIVKHVHRAGGHEAEGSEHGDGGGFDD